MPSPRFQHNYPHDVFLSYTHVDNRHDGVRQWVSQFREDLKARLEIVSGRSVDLWWDADKLGVSDRFDETIAQAVRDSAVLLVVLSPTYFNSEYCGRERQEFNAANASRLAIGTRTRILKVAKFHVDLERYPADLRQLLEYRFYEQVSDSSIYKEFHLSEAAAVQARYYSRVDDVAQEVAGLLSALSSSATPGQSRGAIFLAETTSDLEARRDELRRLLQQRGYDVFPKRELRLLSASELQQVVTEALGQCQLAIHPIGSYYGVVPEGAGKSIVHLQLELSRSGGKHMSRAIWMPGGTEPTEAAQQALVNEARTTYPGEGFEVLERPFPALVNRLEDLLRVATEDDTKPRARPDIYLVCDNADRATAKTVRSFLFSRDLRVEWTPMGEAPGSLAGSSEHEKLLRRNGAHVVLHGATNEAWLQDRIRELDDFRQHAKGATPVQAILLADPKRGDKEDILVKGIQVLGGYDPTPIADALTPFLESLEPKVAGGAT